ncbi:MAG: thiamine biosynthesis protein ThiF [Treponemataceae bacterium]|nr:thiamine biosynthesis protein ThiF [Treponemataceae bacterium]
MIPTKDEWNGALSARHGEALQRTFSSATVAVCGLGGLGSNIAIALARAGVGKLILIDFDRVDIANLNRQQYKATQIGTYKTEALCENLQEIAPYIALEAITARMTEETAAPLLKGKGIDVVCEAFDNAEAKAMLTNAVLETMPGTFLVAASGLAGMGSANAIQTRRVSSHFYLCGDGTSDVATAGSLVAPRVMLCAAHQAHTVLRILAEQFEA